MSQLGSLFRKITFFESQHVDLALLTDSHEMAALLPHDQEAAVLDFNLHRACTWFFRAKAPLEPAKSWNDVLNSQEECLGVASVITFAFSHISRSDLGMILVEGCVHGNANIQLGSLTLASNESQRTP